MFKMVKGETLETFQERIGSNNYGDKQGSTTLGRQEMVNNSEKEL